MALHCLLVHARVITHNALTVKLSCLIYGTASKAGRRRWGGGVEVVSHRNIDF